MAAKKKSLKQRRLEILEENLKEEAMLKRLKELEDEDYQDDDTYNKKKRLIVTWRSKVSRR